MNIGELRLERLRRDQTIKVVEIRRSELADIVENIHHIDRLKMEKTFTILTG